MNEQSCAAKIGAEWASTREDLETLLTLYHEDPEAYDDDLGRFEDYGTCFDWVAPGTFKGQYNGYFRYQMSGGGPSDEIRYYVGPDFRLQKAEYWFLDWGDGASRDVTQEDVARQVWDHFEDFAPSIMGED